MESTPSDQASQAAVRVLIPPIPLPCVLIPAVTTPLYSGTVSQALRQTLRGEVPKEYPPAPPTTRPRGHGGGAEDVEVGDTSLLTNFSIGGEHNSDTLSEPQ